MSILMMVCGGLGVCVGIALLQMHKLKKDIAEIIEGQGF